MKLKNKINLYTSILFIILLILMNISIYLLFSNMVMNSELDRGKQELERNAAAIERSLGTVATDELLRAYTPIDGLIRIIQENLETFGGTHDASFNKEAQNVEKKFIQSTNVEIVKSESTYMLSSTPIILSNGEVANLQIAKSIEGTTEILHALRIVLIIVTLVAMIPVIISSRLLSNLIIAPITSMIKTMSDIRESGKFKRLTLKSESNDELHEMGTTFNHMIDLLEVNFDKQKQFASSASHELKTPLTVIESYASLLKRRGLQDPKIFEESIEAIHSEAIRMKNMTEQLLLLAKHNEQWNLELKDIDLTEFLTDSAKAFQNAYNRKIIFDSQMDTNAFIYSDEQKLKQLLFIFLDNARKYSDEKITITLSLNNKEETLINISDRGIGINQTELPKVFDRFYRIDKARSRKTGGVGLGLSLAKEIAEALDIDLQLQSVEGIGTTVTLVFNKNHKKLS
ncbi:HAMP domain-containing sensor histidine kinase [Cytobacillus horneckiae]|uniref:histidine kinase n=2 Tax=Cytobacillus horneckiae TaxID=549687 RepID=A0A2N0ZBJ7_9BACI|nr:HAMP domain-containing sensor histidine kinase [Cytobacillus horneckiae]MCM3178996.1 HAMP domain-containing histidine kinase [Cytobacillus horneckiae]MEC1154212.1 HAMP domain-containing sensor histidine kinase [Cytobacillus horneckiae]MED2936243.1 HAMP domain-containing sensor histidine kinase [Cytobacillus horneckiae]PKG26880.1 sensor histidine kinase [Cytobacillus horneckiae]